MWSLIPLLVIRPTVIPLKKCPQQLMNTNNFAQAIVTTLWVYPDLTVDSCAFRNRTDFHKTSKSSSFGYPARRLELNLLKEKLKTKFPPFVHKPKVTTEPTPIDKQTAV